MKPNEWNPERARLYLLGTALAMEEQARLLRSAAEVDSVTCSEDGLASFFYDTSEGEIDPIELDAIVQAAQEQRCRVCFCTTDDCSKCIAATGFACHWVAEDLCSRCQDEEQDLGARIERHNA